MLHKNARYIHNKMYSHVLVPGDGGDSQYRGSVTSECVASHSKVVVTTERIVVKDVDRYLKSRLTVNVTPSVFIMTM